MRRRGIAFLSIVGAFACAPARRSEAPNAAAPPSSARPGPSMGVPATSRPKGEELGDGGIPPLTAAPSATAPPVEPDWVSRRRRERHDAVDRLLDGQLSEAEARCGTEPPDRREACVGAFLDEHQRKLGDRMARSFRGLELATAYGDERCKHVKGPKARKKCGLVETEKLLSELGKDCTTGTDDEKHDCVIDRVLERLGP